MVSSSFVRRPQFIARVAISLRNLTRALVGVGGATARRQSGSGGGAQGWQREAAELGTPLSASAYRQVVVGISVFRSDPTATVRRYAELTDYLAAAVYGPAGFVCAAQSGCRQAARAAGGFFVEAQLPHVGPHYDLTENGIPWRVLVVGLEAGSPDKRVSMPSRSMAVAASRALALADRNPHMRGTTTALHAAFGGVPGNDAAGEYLKLRGEPNPHHLFECFALTNKRLCSAHQKKPADGRTNRASTAPAMDKACRTHLGETIRILEPTLIVLQGKGIRSLLNPLVSRTRAIAVPGVLSGDATLEYAQLGTTPAMIAAFSHPAAYGKLNWGNSPTDPYVTAVCRVVAKARTWWFRHAAALG